ncbi:hypothetical protein [Streptomyces sp. NBC_01092]|uniref:hypothetical protein n=1 Tax=Streptomyces sp. NBC_01092 TaxID=2903748 RepID=UPI0038674C20|nr:hypothetical protein OG254_42985 [Streptomyces sp. NBC_01092]
MPKESRFPKGDKETSGTSPESPHKVPHKDRQITTTKRSKEEIISIVEPTKSEKAQAEMQGELFGLSTWSELETSPEFPREFGSHGYGKLRLEGITEESFSQTLDRLNELSRGKVLELQGSALPVVLTLGAFTLGEVQLNPGTVAAGVAISCVGPIAAGFFDELGRSFFEYLQSKRRELATGDPFAKCEAVLKRKLALPEDAPEWCLESVTLKFEDENNSNVRIDRATSPAGFAALGNIRFDELNTPFEAHWFSLGAVWLALTSEQRAYIWNGSAWAPVSAQ